MPEQVAIVGGGPVGLALGCLLTQAGVDCCIYEARIERSQHSRAIGIHPPALQVLESIGVLPEFLAEGVSVSQGQAFYGNQPLGTLALPSPVLSIPQTRTEAILEARLRALNPNAFQPGVTVNDIRALQADFIVGCDGKSSTVRQQSGIRWRGKTYPDTYLMGDFDDDTEFGNEAIICLSAQGLVESFPLPQRKRRWVAWSPSAFEKPTAEHLSALIEARISQALPVSSCIWLSPFGIERYLAERFVQENVVLAGDAAHVVSPIGGQGMNLGFLDADAVATALIQILQHGAAPEVALHNYDTRQKSRAKRAGRQAALNTYLGRPCGALSVPLGFVKLLLCCSSAGPAFCEEVYDARYLAVWDN
ncbi:MAG: NAD(P)/FAD-dependent oxidoreductase [Armatimonas sp.]